MDIFSEDGSDDINHSLSYGGRHKILDGNLELSLGCVGLEVHVACVRKAP